jgi:hypothetical protein
MRPGHLRILSSLLDGEKAFTRLKETAKLDATTLSQYLKQLTGSHIIERNPETGRYYIPKTLQPLNPSSFPTGWQVMYTLMGDIGFYVDFISGLKDPAECQAALTQFLHIHFSLLTGCLVQVVIEACEYDDPSLADEFIQRSLEFFIVPWIHLLGLACFRNKELSDKPLANVADTFIKIAEEAYRAFDFHRER